MKATLKNGTPNVSHERTARCKNIGIERNNGCLSIRESIEFREICDEYIDKQVEEWKRDVPVSKLPDNRSEFDWKVYQRGLLETAYRIRLLRVVESKAISEIAKFSPDAAKIWAEYEADEMLHDQMFLDDLVTSGVHESAINSYDPTLETKLLTGYFSYLLDHEGPLGVVVYSYLVEYVNVKMELMRVDKLSNLLGETMVVGQRAHAYTDINHDHPGMVWGCLSKLIQTEKDKQSVFEYFDDFKKILMLFMNSASLKEGVQ